MTHKRVIRGRGFQRIEVEMNGTAAKITAFDRHGRKSLHIFEECISELADTLEGIAIANKLARGQQEPTP